MEWCDDVLEVNGYVVNVKYTKDNIEMIFKPLIRKLQALYQKNEKRILIYLVAPPACGKSSLALYLIKLSQQLGYDNMQAIGMDGFHYSNSYLKSHYFGENLLYNIKGCPESFDLPQFQQYLEKTCLKDTTWPIYDRLSHEPKQHAYLINQDIVIVEGNYLLLEEEGWSDLKRFCTYSIYINSDETLLKDRLIERKAKGNITHEQAYEFYVRSDQKNVQRVMNHSASANLNLYLDADGIYHIEK